MRGEYPQDHIRYTGTELGDAVSESIRKTIYGMGAGGKATLI